MEPASLQYFQQGVWMVIDKYVRSRPYLRDHFGFHDEIRNRTLAQKGSMTGNYATIDLSAASDSVGYELVKRIFRGTWIARYIVCTRSTHTILPDGSKIALRKFAPMGSALCFPIETIVFSAICEHVTRGLGFSGDFSVYGDDIIVPVRCCDRLLTVLSNLGFRVNLRKSFIDPSNHYRESCGGEFLDGFEVTPMRISRRYNANDYCDHFTALISLANEAYRRNFYSLRHFFLKKMRSNGIKPLFASTSVVGRSYSNYHLPRRFNTALQRDEVRASTLKSKRLTSIYPDDDSAQLAEEIRYRHWLESTYLRQSLEWGFESYVGKMDEYVSYHWFNAPVDANGNASEDDESIFGFLG